MIRRRVYTVTLSLVTLLYYPYPGDNLEITLSLSVYIDANPGASGRG